MQKKNFRGRILQARKRLILLYHPLTCFQSGVTTTAPRTRSCQPQHVSSAAARADPSNCSCNVRRSALQQGKRGQREDYEPFSWLASCIFYEPFSRDAIPKNLYALFFLNRFCDPELFCRSGCSLVGGQSGNAWIACQFCILYFIYI